MKLTPLDIKKQEFKKVMRGYDPVEVDTFMEMVANEFEESLKEQMVLKDKGLELETQLKDYRQIEKTLQQTLLHAQEATGKTYEAARREAEVLVKEAEMKAAKIVDQSHGDLSRLKDEMVRLKARRESLIGRLRILLSSELDLLKSLEMGGEEALGGASTLEGTGKESMGLETILKNLSNEATPHSH